MISRKYITEPLIVNRNGINACRIYDKKEGEIIHIKLEPNSSLPAHKTPVDVAFYILEGELLIEIGEEREKFCADTIIESPKDIPHALFNESNQIARVMVIKMPKPAKKTN